MFSVDSCQQKDYFDKKKSKFIHIHAQAVLVLQSSDCTDLSGGDGRGESSRPTPDLCPHDMRT